MRQSSVGWRGAVSVLAALAAAVVSAPAAAQRATLDAATLEEYIAFLSLPNDAANPADALANARFVQAMMQRRGIASELLYDTDRKAPPAVFGEVKTPGATKTIVFYAHYDGQPVVPERWAPGLAPFSPVAISRPIEQGGTVLGPWSPGAKFPPGWRIAARSAADDKAGVMVALNAFRDPAGIAAQLGVNVKFFFEGEEEKGSPNLAAILRAHRGKLGGDLWVMVDGPRHTAGYRAMVLGVRGVVDVGITIYGANRPLHAGNYGNWAPNPALRLAALLGSLKDADGRILIPGFYDDAVPATAAELAEIAKAPSMDTTRQSLGIARTQGGGKLHGELVLQPGIEITGLRAGATGASAANVIPTEAEARLDMRLVKGDRIDRQLARLVRFVEGQGYHVLDRAPTADERLAHPLIAKIVAGFGYEAQRTPLGQPMVTRVKQLLESVSPDRLVVVPSTGGSLPLSIFERELGAPVVTIPVVNADNNQHGENENVDPAFLAEGITNIRAIMEDDFSER
ncbi:M20/M25/M40 family metallo-hydrolase [Sphingopyxis sp.]|jgi:acetylornithine deacetylase/succinyl-diaminopimelate desuccinylase-like protein|uniref:M20/M25/M40 family metallo-hydrolase n=1 Tax=Sphingopyxis sp. TaxID=1908224 RepID=UPI003F71EB94